MKKISTLFILIMLLSSFSAFAEDVGFPRLGSLKRTITNVRAGPGTQYPILWVFNRKGWPVQLISRYQSWYKIRDVEGEEGWVYASLISQVHTVSVKAGEPAVMYKKQSGEYPVLRFAPTSVLNLKRCGKLMCEVSYRNYSGWIEKTKLEMTELIK